MFRSVMLLAALVALAAPAPNPANVFEIDISPEEAQQYLNSPPFTEPQLSGRTAVLPLVRWDNPSFRTAEAGPTLGHYWKNGHEIENTNDYVEEVYDAAQFHGQDGLGGYAYGYQAPESSKVENRERSGDITGSYTYKSGDDLIKVRYWADSEGFHQEDNLPRVVLEPVQEADDVRQARLAHEKAWQEAAALAAQQPDPQGEYDTSRYEHEGSASAPVGVVASAPGGEVASPEPAAAPAPREGKAYAQAQSSYQGAPQQQYQQSYQKQQYQGQQNSYQGQQSGQKQQSVYQGQQSGQKQQSVYQGQQTGQKQQGVYQGQQSGQQVYQGQQSGQGQQGQYQGQAQQGQYQRQQGSVQGQYQGQQGQVKGSDEEVEPTGPPRGFFYSFTYPVSIIEPKNAGQQGGQVHPGTPVDQDTVSVGRQG